MEKSNELLLKSKNCERLEYIEPIPHEAIAKAVKEMANGSLCSGARINEIIAVTITKLKRNRSRTIPALICRILAMVCKTKIAGADHFQIRWVPTHVS